MTWLKTLDALHLRTIQNKYVQIFTSFVRCLLALGFIPPSIPKIRHLPFTSLPDENPVGHYFNALYATGFYYDFIGWMQLIAALLLLLPQTAHLGTFLFFPIIINITILTISVGFKGTWLITLLMSLAGLYLMAWEYDRLKLLLTPRRSGSLTLIHEKWLLPLFFGLGTLFLLILMVWLGIANLHKIAFYKLIPFIGGGLLFGAIVYLHHRYMKTGPVSSVEKQ